MTRRRRNRDIPPYNGFLHETLLNGALRKIAVKTPEGIKEFHAFEVTLRQIEKTANAGSPHAQNHLMALYLEASEAKRAKVDAEVEAGRVFRERQCRRVQIAIACGEDPAKILPHPDDIIIDAEVGYSIKGPVCEADLKRIDHTLEFIDVLLLQAALEERLHGLKDDVQEGMGTPMVLAMLLNHLLPQRFQKTDDDVLKRFFEFTRRTKRNLLRDSHQAWQRLRIPFSRGKTFADISTVTPKVITTVRALQFASRHVEQHGSISTTALSDEIMRIYSETRG